jgi:hypothetical protein
LFDCRSMCRSWFHWYKVCALPQSSRERIVTAFWQPTEQNSGDCSWRAIALGKEIEPSS